MPYMMIAPYVDLNTCLLLSAINHKCLQQVCGYIMSECHLPLGNDWPSAGEYGGCTH